MDSDKIDIAGMEVKMLEQQIEDQQQMLHHLHKRVKDHAKEKDCLIEMNEECEKIIEEKNKEIQEVSKYKKMLIESKEASAIMRKKFEVANNLIKTLQMDNCSLEKKLEDQIKNNEKSVDVSKLVEEIENIQKINREKEEIIENIENEKEVLQSKLVKIEQENDTLLKKMENEKEDVQNLSDELGILDPHSHNVSPTCEPCDELFEKTTNVKSHDTNYHDGSLVKKIWKLKVLQLEKSINSQKLKIASNIIQLKEKEVSENRKCACKRFCRIVHQKYNWKKCFSEEIFNRFKMLETAYSCISCDKTFENVDCLNLHVKTVHVEDFSREENNGGE